MQFSIALIKSSNQFLLKNYNKDVCEEHKTLDIIELDEHPIEAIFYPTSLSSDEELMPLLQKQLKFCPIREAESVSLSEDSFQALSYNDAATLLSKVQDSWTLQNNISLLENLFEVLDHLKTLFRTDRSAFFEELWFTIRSNLATHTLKMIYNDVIPKEKPTLKDKLIQVNMEGHRLPSPVTGGEIEKKLLENYQAMVGTGFTIHEYVQDRGELVATTSINKSPILIMAKVVQVSMLQRALLKTLFDGLNAI